MFFFNFIVNTQAGRNGKLNMLVQTNRTKCSYTQLPLRGHQNIDTIRQSNRGSSRFVILEKIRSDADTETEDKRLLKTKEA